MLWLRRAVDSFINIVPEEHLLGSNYTVFLQEMDSSTLKQIFHIPNSDVWTLYVKEWKESPPHSLRITVFIPLFISFITI